jgi:hypothetical protein
MLEHIELYQQSEKNERERERRGGGEESLIKMNRKTKPTGRIKKEIKRSNLFLEITYFKSTLKNNYDF